MESTVTITSPDPDELRTLNMWLRDEPELQRKVTLLPEPPQQGEMSGGMLSGLAILAGQAGTLAVVARSLTSWLGPRRGKVSFVIRRPDGGEIEFTAEQTRGADMDDVHRVIERFLDGGAS
ncbi:hypothetical protein [Dactylosporangium sp. NPDC000521]|uniref:effector-associated constant component EACC1 n=1 Tax=Dactylosporangium sp. NPDC000521 TaxID=3363975 RepID=UPI0036D00271